MKPLEWREEWGGVDEDIPEWRGRDTLGIYVGFTFAGRYKLETHAEAPPKEVAAKKAALERDYAARVLACMEPTPPGASPVEGVSVAEAARVLLAEMDAEEARGPIFGANLWAAMIVGDKERRHHIPDDEAVWPAMWRFMRATLAALAPTTDRSPT